MEVSDDSDDEFLTLAAAYIDWELQRRPRMLRDRSDPINNYNDVEFRMRFRLPKQSVVDLTTRLRDQLEHRMRRHWQLSVVNQVLVTLRFMASGSFLVNMLPPLPRPVDHVASFTYIVYLHCCRLSILLEDGFRGKSSFAIYY
jgi:hypothetical protein